MKTKAIAIVAIVLLCGCCSKRSATASSWDRHADSVASLASRRTGTIDREQVVETIRMRQDSSGNLVVVSHDVVRVKDRGTAVSSDTTGMIASSSASGSSSEVVEEKAAVRRATPWWLVAPAWALLCILVTAGAFVVIRKGQRDGH